MLRVLRLGPLPNLKMELRLAIYRIYVSYLLTGLDLVSGFNGQTLQLAVEGEIISMLDQHALIVSRHDKHL